MLVVLVIAALLYSTWSQGTFDHGLAQWGLNARPCERNILSTVYCGDEIQAYRLKLRRLSLRVSRSSR